MASRRKRYQALGYRHITSEGLTWDALGLRREDVAVPIESGLALNIVLHAAR